MSFTYSEMAKLAGNSQSLTNQIRSLIQIRAQKAWQKGRSSGRINAGSLPYVPVGKEKIFKKRNEAVTLNDCCFTFLGDASGSMTGPKFYHLGAAFSMINEACKTLGVPFELLCFSEKYVSSMDSFVPLHFVVKSYTAKRPTDAILSNMATIHDKHLGDNADGEALLWAYNRMRRRKEKKKILVVLSDGAPCTGAEGDASEHLKYVVKQLEKQIVVYGVGLLTSCRDYYRNHTYIKEASQLEGMFLNLIKKEVLSE